MQLEHCSGICKWFICKSFANISFTFQYCYNSNNIHWKRRTRSKKTFFFAHKNSHLNVLYYNKKFSSLIKQFLIKLKQDVDPNTPAYCNKMCFFSVNP